MVYPQWLPGASTILQYNPIATSSLGTAFRTHSVFYNDQWRANPRGGWKLTSLGAVLAHADFTGKRSTPYRPDAVHDYMHAKVTVADDVVFAGSFNLSHSGELNAENVLEIADPALADQLAAYVDSVRALYPRAPLPGPGS